MRVDTSMVGSESHEKQFQTGDALPVQKMKAVSEENMKHLCLPVWAAK